MVTNAAGTEGTDDETCWVPVLWNEHGINVLLVLLAFLSVYSMQKYTENIKRQKLDRTLKQGKQLPETHIRVKWWPVKVSRQDVGMRTVFRSLKECQVNTRLVGQFLREHYPSSDVSANEIAAISESGFLLWDQEKMVGCVFVQSDEQVFLDENIKKWFVFCLCIHKDYRLQGLATKLMQQLEYYAKVHGVQEMQLWVDVEREETMSEWRSNHRANELGQLSWKTAMYENLGFEGICGEQVADKEYVVMMRKIVT